MTQLADNRRTIRAVAPAVGSQGAGLVAAMIGLLDATDNHGLDPERLDANTIQFRRLDGQQIEATAKYGGITNECHTCHQPPGRPHTDYCPQIGLVP